MTATLILVIQLMASTICTFDNNCRFWDTSLDVSKEDLTQATSVTLFETPKEPFPTENRKPVDELLVCQVQVTHFIPSKNTLYLNVFLCV